MLIYPSLLLVFNNHSVCLSLSHIRPHPRRAVLTTNLLTLYYLSVTGAGLLQTIIATV